MLTEKLGNSAPLFNNYAQLGAGTYRFLFSNLSTNHFVTVEVTITAGGGAAQVSVKTLN